MVEGEERSRRFSRTPCLRHENAATLWHGCALIGISFQARCRWHVWPIRTDNIARRARNVLSEQKRHKQARKRWVRLLPKSKTLRNKSFVTEEWTKNDPRQCVHSVAIEGFARAATYHQVRPDYTRELAEYFLRKLHLLDEDGRPAKNSGSGPVTALELSGEAYCPDPTYDCLCTLRTCSAVPVPKIHVKYQQLPVRDRTSGRERREEWL